MARAARELKLGGVFASALTPHFPGTHEPDYSGFLDLLDFIAAGGVRGIVALGPAGEFPHFGLSERQRLIYLGVKRTRVPLLSAVSHSTLDGAVQLASDAVSSGADGILISAPTFYQYSQSDLENFFLEFAGEVGDVVPLILSNSPRFSSALAPDTIARILASKRYAGVEDSSGDTACFEQLLELRRNAPFALLCGSDYLAPEALRRGADGLVSSSATAVPELMTGLFRAVQNPAAHADWYEAKLEEFLEHAFVLPFPLALKKVTELRRLKPGANAIPLSIDTQAKLDTFAAWFRTWWPETLAKII